MNDFDIFEYINSIDEKASIKKTKTYLSKVGELQDIVRNNPNYLQSPNMSGMPRSTNPLGSQIESVIDKREKVRDELEEVSATLEHLRGTELSNISCGELLIRRFINKESIISISMDYVISESG